MLRSMTWAILALAVGLACSVGCQQQTSTPPASTPTATTREEHGHEHAGNAGHTDGHSHGVGPHEGTLADWGGGKYHVEFTVDHDKQEAVVYVLGSDEKTPAAIQTLDGTLLLTISEPSFQVTLQAAPLDGESDGKASRYVGTHESLGVVREFAGSISAEVEGTPYAGDFTEEPHGAHEHE
jgi:hypothetical protein